MPNSDLILTLAPPPDFRHVGLAVTRPRALGVWVTLLGTGALVGTTLRGSAGIVLGVGVAAALGAVTRALWAAPPDPAAPNMTIVPWGIVVDWSDRSRILRWPGVARVQVDAVHGRDQGTSITRYSVVTIETDRERFVGRAPGSLPLERLTVHLNDYAREASHRIALDLDGALSGEGPSEPDAELVLSAARTYATTSGAACRLDLALGRYRDGSPREASPFAESELGAILRDRSEREVDPRPFAAVLAAELGAFGLVDDLVELVQSPLPLLAAIAKVAATKLGVARARVGTLEEVEPFLLGRDAEALAEWLVA